MMIFSPLLTLLSNQQLRRKPLLLCALSSICAHHRTLTNLRTSSPNYSNHKSHPPSRMPPFHIRQNPQIPCHEFDPKTVGEIISLYSNDWKSALDFFYWVETESRFSHTSDTYNRTIDILGKFFEFDVAWGLIYRMRESPASPPDHTTFRTLFKRYAACHLLKEAIDAYERSAEFGLKDAVCLSDLVDALCENKHVIEARDLLCLSQFPDQTKLHNMILRGYFKMSWWKKCREIWKEMELKGVVRDLYSYSIYMDIEIEAGKPWRAVRLYREMKKNGIPLDVVVYNNVVLAAGLCDGSDEAISLYKEMKECGCNPNVVTHNTIIKLLCREGKFKNAFAFLNIMKKKGCTPNAITYHCFFRSMNTPKEILRLFERMIADGCCPRVDTYVMLIKKLSAWGFLWPVFAVWEKMNEQGCKPNEFAYSAMIDALVQSGMLELAQKYEKEMLEKGLPCKPRKVLRSKGFNDEFDHME